MNQKRLLIGISALVVAVFSFLGGSQVVRSVGYAPISESNYATTTSSADASATVSYVACIGQCQLSSVVVSQVGTAGWVTLRDATTTATSTQIEPSPFSSSTYAVAVGRPIATFTGASDVAGAYPFDVVTTYGLVIETSTGFNGEYQVMWKK